MVRALRICIIRMTVLLFFFPLPSMAESTVIMKVFVNAVDKGDYFFILSPQGDVLIAAEDLREMGLDKLFQTEERTMAGKRNISLSSLSPSLRYEVDEKEAVLRLNVEPMLLGKHTSNLIEYGPKAILRKDDSAFLNYSINYSLGDELDFIGLQAPWELAVSMNGWLAYSSFSYRKTDTETDSVRLMTNIIKDSPEKLTRTVFGDFSAYSGILGSGGLFGGVSISKNFSLDRSFVRAPTLDLSGIVETPSEVEVYVGGRLIQVEQLPPGEFELLNVIRASGAQDTTLIIRDAFGREQRIDSQIYLSSTLLKTGLHEYSYNLGFRREEYGQDSFKYGDPTLVAFHRYGVTRNFTAGLRAEADKEVVNIGPEVSWLLPSLGEINTVLAWSDDGEYTGYGGFFNYRYQDQPFSGNLALKGLSENYTNLNIDAAEDKIRYQALIGISYNLKDFGSISARYSNTDNHINTDTTMASLSYAKRLAKNISLYARASRVKSDEVDNEFSVGLSMFLGRSRSGGLSHRVQENRTTDTAYISKSPPLGTGYGYRYLIEQNDEQQGQQEIGGAASMQYNGPYGVYSGDYRRVGEENRYDFKMSGAVAAINGSAYFSRPIRDSFALVKVSDLEGINIKYSNQIVGVTDNEGELLVPGLLSYYENKLSLEYNDLPINYEISEIDKYISTPFHAGGIAMFDVKKLQGFAGQLYVDEKGKSMPAEYWGLELTVDKKTTEYIVGNRGEFYLENILPGTYPTRLFMEEKECRFQMTIPSSNDVMVNIGRLSCEMD